MFLLAGIPQIPYEGIPGKLAISDNLELEGEYFLFLSNDDKLYLAFINNDAIRHIKRGWNWLLGARFVISKNLNKLKFIPQKIRSFVRAQKIENLLLFGENFEKLAPYSREINNSKLFKIIEDTLYYEFWLAEKSLVQVVIKTSQGPGLSPQPATGKDKFYILKQIMPPRPEIYFVSASLRISSINLSFSQDVNLVKLDLERKSGLLYFSPKTNYKIKFAPLEILNAITSHMLLYVDEPDIKNLFFLKPLFNYNLALKVSSQLVNIEGVCESLKRGLLNKRNELVALLKSAGISIDDKKLTQSITQMGKRSCSKILAGAIIYLHKSILSLNFIQYSDELIKGIVYGLNLR